MQVLLKPIISEKSLIDTANSKFVFQVAVDANKQQIAKTIEDIYKVNVTGVNIIRLHSEKRLIRGRYQIKTKVWKKAIVTLKKGQKIPGFEISEGK